MGAACSNCNGERWVCENHPNVMWDGDQTCCGGAGMPCPACNPCDANTPPAMPPGSVTIWSAEQERGEVIMFGDLPVKGGIQ